MPNSTTSAATTRAQPDVLLEVLERLERGEGLDARVGERDDTLLTWAVGAGYHDIAVLLVEAGADVNAPNGDGNTPLLRAACEGRRELASVLVRVGAKLDVQNHDGYSALVLAKRRGNTDVVEMLLAAGADRRLVAKGGARFEAPGHSPKVAIAGRRDPAVERRILEAIAGSRDGRIEGRTLEKYINLEAEDRFVSTRVLREAYVRHEGSERPSERNYAPLDGMELGIVSSAVPEIARAVSSLLCRSLEDARDDRGGHLPPEVVRRVQLEIISPYGVAHIWGVTGHRFVLSRPAGPDRSEILATILVGRSKDTIFFFTGRYNNLRHSTMAETVDLAQPDREGSTDRFFERFRFPPIERFKPAAYHHIANFVVSKDQRGRSLSRFLLVTIVDKYARDSLVARGLGVEHSQHLLCGRGFWQIGDPPWLSRMERLGFYLRRGAESFFVEHPWAPLPAVRHPESGETISNLAYNRSYGLPDRYRALPEAPSAGVHLDERIPEVTALSQDPRAKLQYFQTLFDFTR